MQGRGRGKKVREGRGREIGWVCARDTRYKFQREILKVILFYTRNTYYNFILAILKVIFSNLYTLVVIYVLAHYKT